MYTTSLLSVWGPRYIRISNSGQTEALVYIYFSVIIDIVYCLILDRKIWCYTTNDLDDMVDGNDILMTLLVFFWENKSLWRSVANHAVIQWMHRIMQYQRSNGHYCINLTHDIPITWGLLPGVSILMTFSHTFLINSVI